MKALVVYGVHKDENSITKRVASMLRERENIREKIRILDLSKKGRGWLRRFYSAVEDYKPDVVVDLHATRGMKKNIGYIETTSRSLFEKVGDVLGADSLGLDGSDVPEGYAPFKLYEDRRGCIEVVLANDGGVNSIDTRCSAMGVPYICFDFFPHGIEALFYYLEAFLSQP